MKKLVLVFLVLVLQSCNNQGAPNCFQNAGDSVQKEFALAPFTKITVFKNIELIVKDDEVQRVIVETGEHLLTEVSAVVENGRLVLKDENNCNFTRDYGITKVYVSAPNLTEIRNSSQFTVSSNGVLNYSTLKLFSEDYSGNFYNIGLFDVTVNSSDISVVINNFTTTFIKGTTTNLKINHASGDGRFEGRDLIAQNVNIYHRGSNDIIVNPKVSLTANLVSTGNVVSINTPELLDFREAFTGRVIFE